LFADPRMAWHGMAWHGMRMAVAVAVHLSSSPTGEHSMALTDAVVRQAKTTGKDYTLTDANGLIHNRLA